MDLPIKTLDKIPLWVVKQSSGRHLDRGRGGVGRTGLLLNNEGSNPHHTFSYDNWLGGRRVWGGIHVAQIYTYTHTHGFFFPSPFTPDLLIWIRRQTKKTR